jgi:hypothetical protein
MSIGHRADSKDEKGEETDRGIPKKNSISKIQNGGSGSGGAGGSSSDSVNLGVNAGTPRSKVNFNIEKPLNERGEFAKALNPSKLKRFHSMRSDCPDENLSESEPLFDRSQSEKVSEIKAVMKSMNILSKYNFERRNKMAQRAFNKPRSSSRKQRRNLPRDAMLLKKMMDKFFEKENFEEEDPQLLALNSINTIAAGETLMRNSIRKRLSNNSHFLHDDSLGFGLSKTSYNTPRVSNDISMKLNDIPFENKSVLSKITPTTKLQSTVFFKNNEKFVINVKKEENERQTDLSEGKKSSTDSDEEEMKEDEEPVIPKSAGFNSSRKSSINIRRRSSKIDSKNLNQIDSFSQALRIDKIQRNIKKESKISKIDNILKYRRNSVKKEIKLSLQHYLKNKISISSISHEQTIDEIFKFCALFEQGFPEKEKILNAVMIFKFQPIFSQVFQTKFSIEVISDYHIQKRGSYFGESHYYSESLKNLSGEENNSERE